MHYDLTEGLYIEILRGPGEFSRYSNSRFGDRIPAGGKIFSTCPDRSWGSPILLYNRYQVIPVGKAAGA